jgi:predicted glycogen debranching enzyme
MKSAVTNRMSWSAERATQPEPLLSREWLVTNGLGGYAAGSVAGATTRRYHGYLVSALPNPIGRAMMVTHLVEQIRLPDGTTHLIGGDELHSGLDLHGAALLREFRLESGLPVWTYTLNEHVIEKRVFMPHIQNTVFLVYRLVRGDGTLRVKVRPSVHFRHHDAPVDEPHPGKYRFTAVDDRYEVCADGAPYPPVRMKLFGARGAYTVDPRRVEDVHYRLEAERGYPHISDHWSPGVFRGDLSRDHDVSLIFSTESWDTMLALSPSDALEAEYTRRRKLLLASDPKARNGMAAELVFAADQFIITPAGRVEDAARAHASGDEVRTIIAGYHWFTDWGRDTMISLEGLTLTTGRHLEAGYILRTFAHYVRDGLIPNLFPEGERDGLYHTADASLWFFHAVSRYLTHTDDRETLRDILPQLKSIVEHHLKGTRFHIGVDPADGLLTQGEAGYQLTWMDAKVGDWVVTPRRGKAVEINALWYNALRLMQQWLHEAGDAQGAAQVAGHAERAYRSFNERFWNPATGYLFDVVDGEHGNDAACRPNQVFAISLPHAVLDRSRWEAVMNVVTQQLVTPVGLRSLAPGHPDFKPRYDGDRRARDAAYHQGTVWAWLIGPYVDAYLKLHPGDHAGARKYLEGFVHHLGESCIGTISEIADAEPPFTPRGCVAQAWSVAEVLRCLVKTST